MKPEDINKQPKTIFLISCQIKRGITFIQGLDTENVKKKMTLKTVVNKQELIQLKAFVKNLKDDSFVYVTESAGIVGRGFEEVE